MALDATPGGANANSYVTEAYAYAYFQDHVQYDKWAPLDHDAVLIYATMLLDVLVDWIGVASTDTQALLWPRILPDGTDDGTIPSNVQRATCELALYVGVNGFDIDSEKIRKLNIGPIKMDLNVDKALATFPPIVTAMLSGLGAIRTTSSNMISTPRLIRT